MQAVEGLTAEALVQKIGALSIEVSRAFSEISEKLVREVNLLETLREAVEVQREELSRLHKIDVAATALDQLVADYAREKERLENEIHMQRALWEEETERVERERKEQEEFPTQAHGDPPRLRILTPPGWLELKRILQGWLGSGVPEPKRSGGRGTPEPRPCRRPGSLTWEVAWRRRG